MKNLVGAKTHFSLSESIYDPEKLVKAVKKAGYDGLVVSDVASIEAMPIMKAKADGLKIGLSLQLAVVNDLTWTKAKRGEPKRKPNPTWYTTLYVRNDAGFKDVTELLTLANREDHFGGAPAKPQIVLQELIDFVSRGNLTMTLGSAYSALQLRNADSVIETLVSNLNADSVLVELCPIDSAFYDAHNVKAINAALLFGLRPVLTRPTLNQKDEVALRNTMNSILSHDKVDSIFRREPADDLHVMEPPDLLVEIEGAVKRAAGRGLDLTEVAELFKEATDYADWYFTGHPYEWKKMEISLPVLSATPLAELVKACKAGWAKRLGTEVFGYKPDASKLPEYQERLKYELSVLQKMKFEDYFLLVNYIVQWSKSNGVLVGPGRGSVGGSLVAYLMGITDVDPIRFDLIFERFINPERIDLPDIDLDFMQSRRQDIVAHLIDHFGPEHTVQVANYSGINGSGAIQAVGKAFNLPEKDYECSKLVPKESGVPVELEKAVAYVPELEKMALLHPEPWKHAVGLQGVFKNFATHAAGVVVSKVPVTERGWVNARSGIGIVNWDKRVIEDFGLVKLDVLGLATLDIIRLSHDYILEQTGVDMDFTTLPLDDRKVLDNFAAGKTHGVFQFESGGMRNLLKNLGKDGGLTFDDVVAATALFRPGPIQAGLMDLYVQIKLGYAAPDYPHPNMEPALKSTNSVMVYQEQVMRVSRDLAGYTGPEADTLRKIMGKKDPVKMAEQKDKFVDGCVKTSGLSVSSAEHIFDQIDKFAGYGFNKSHSVAYTLISYIVMWVKTYHPEAFYAACLSILAEEKLAGIAKDALENDIHIVPPDINKSSDRYEIGFDAARGQKVLYAPFQSVKGLSEKSAAAIMEAKKALGKPFSSKAEFVLNVNRRACNKTAQEKLDLVGAFSTIEAGQVDARHPDRVRDQKVLLPGIVTANVKANRGIVIDGVISAELVKIVDECNACTECPFAGRPHPQPVLGKKPKIMIVLDSVSYKEEEKNQMLMGDTGTHIKEAMAKAGIKMSEVYVTSFIKARKRKEDPDIGNDTMNGCAKFLEREIALLKPPVIVALGSKSIRHLVPDVRGGWEELCGKSHFDPAHDCTVVMGFNPAMIYHDDTKKPLLDAVFAQVAEIFS